ncbi:hypothetical protein MF271_04190 [Deinococcus sp. KNUC1210]|uniref:hypothetical protein n=1 Tax=Deinococcus sp. KNUC1210 TaxID=2917691 RepID=UPI001EF14935|nr:hypothetical protein [Deinococcus sp. KNUC1210]ULH15843.1 hypothetical protein MF271_04190 [Deinococcus sp. KNUC1210]
MKNITLYGGLLTMTVVLMACTQPLPIPEPTLKPSAGPAIWGQISDWKGATGKVELLASGTEQASVTNPVLSTGEVSADGTFALSLPSLEAITPHLAPADSLLSNNIDSLSSNNILSCKGSVNSSDISARGFAIRNLTASQYTKVVKATPRGYNSITESSYTKIWVYMSSPTTLSGIINCTYIVQGDMIFSALVDLNINLKQGWNIIEESDGADSKITTTVDGSVPWYIF